MKRTSYTRFLARAAMTLLAVFCFIGARAQFSEDFEGGSMPAGWTTEGPGTWLVGTGDNAPTTGAGEGTYNALIKHSATNNVTKLITPEIDLSSATSPEFSFMYVMRSWAGDTDELRVYYRASSSEEWTMLAEYTDAVSAWTTVEGIVLPNLSSTYQLAFEMTDNWGYGVGIDNIVIGTESCAKPSTFEVSDITATGATFEWEDTGAESYSFEYKKASDTEWTAVSVEGVGRGDASIKSYTLSDLVPGTSYNVRVKAICGAGSESGYRSASFMTLFGIPLVEEFGTSIPTGWAKYSGLLSDVMAGTAELATTAYGWSFGENNGVFDNHARVNIYGTSCKYWLVLPTLALENMEKASKGVQLMFDVAYTAYSGTGAPAQTGTDDKFVVLIKYDEDGDGEDEWHILRQWDNAGSEYVLNDLNTTPITVSINLTDDYAGKDITIAFYAESTEGNADNNLHIDNVSIDDIPACAKPTNFAVNYEGGTTATVTWEGNSGSYNIDVNGTVTEGVSSPYTLADLELGTDYEVMVQASCGDDGTSDWTAPVSFKTDLCMPEDMCALTFTVTDSYGDGWNGASIGIYEYNSVENEVGELLASITNQNLDGVTGDSQTEPETQTYTLNFCNGQELAIFWTGGNYDSECSYTITDLNGDIVAQDDTNLSMAYTIDCTVTDCRRPTDFVASEIGSRSAVLSWTENGEATAWEIAYMANGDEEITTITVESNPYTLTGLDPETTYYAQVTPVCDVDKPSEVISWTTDIANPAPMDLAVDKVTAISAEVSWTADAEATGAVLEYANAEGASISFEEYKYDNGSLAGTIGLGGGAFQWGVMFPAGSYTGNIVSKVSVFDANAMTTGSLTIYNDGDTAPANAVASAPVTFTGVGDFIDIAINATIDDTKNVWVIFNNESGEGYPAATSNDDLDDANGRWVEINGTWYDMANVGVTGRCFMVRAEIGTEDLSSLTWTTVEDATSPYEITGLTRETSYFVRVKSIYADGESSWVRRSFTTKAGTEDPIDLAAETTSTTATLSWTGYQDSYNVRYSKSTVLFKDDFDNGMGNWTTIDADGDGYDWILATEAAGVYHNDGVDLSGQGHNGSNDFLISGSYSNVVGALTPDNYLVSPQVDLGGSISFYAQAADANYAAEHFGVAVSTTGNTDAADFTTIAEWTMTAAGTAAKAGSWGKFTVDLSDYANQQGYVAIRHFGTSDQFLINIDDVVIYAPVVEWTELTTDDTSIEISNLDSNSEYEWQVQGILSDEETTDWVSSTFTTVAIIELANNASDNSDIIDANNGKVANVTLTGRTLFKDGNWNTICLPFDVTLEGSPLEGATAKTLSSASIDDETKKVTLTFGEAVTELEAGVPYIIKWESGANIADPVFEGVTIKKTLAPVSLANDQVEFIGYYDALALNPDGSGDFDAEEVDNIYYLADDGKTLKYTGQNRTLKACRAFFWFDDELVGNSVEGRNFILDFGDGETTGIAEVSSENNGNGAWYNINGVKYDNQPTRKGLYIQNGKKVVIR